MPLSIAAAQELWQPAGTYLNAASFGLPPRPAWDDRRTSEASSQRQPAGTPARTSTRRISDRPCAWRPTPGIRAAMRNGRLRTSWHVYNTDDDVGRALAALKA